MLIVKATDLRKEWDGLVLFENVSFEIAEGQRVAIFGRNGTGKTTLLKGLSGQTAFDHGSVHRHLPLEEWGWLEQHPEGVREQTVLNFVLSGSESRYALKLQLEELQRRMSREESAELLNRYGELHERYMQQGGYDWELQADKCLQRVKLDPGLWQQPFHCLSGGQKTRAQLARLMVREPKFIVLDEPTNHLDEETLSWLEQWLRQYAGTVLFVSHDRYFLDRTASAIYELTGQGGRMYPGGYSDYRKQKDIEWQSQEALYRKQEQAREKLMESIRRYQQWFHQAHQAAGQNDFLRSKAKKNVSRLKAKEAALERLERDRVRKPREEGSLRMQLKDRPFAAETLLRMEKVRFAYDGGRMIFQGLNANVNRGDRVAVIGPNGAGKTTLLRLMTGSLTPASGEVKHHPQTKIGYFAQELDQLNLDETILDSLLRLPEMTQSHARTILGCFLFSGDEVFKRIGDLSMGEKCRVAFLHLYFGGFNLLILDEPTNYLDIDTREKVEEALLEYQGALVLVSHDRYLLRNIANRLLILDGKEAKAFPGTYDEYVAKRRDAAYSAERRRQENEIGQLELKLAQLMAEPEPELEADRQQLMADIKRLRALLISLKQS
ncbi:ribosomal protection-like ABC-F family protein [Paenibacillus ehimensis]|uniref:ABC-F type ribosomal protection protein n=1 Tax=Paenibacillus ehimensis TaxID=79264 RepID=A0ABT8VFB6_9BACL|nr:ABC-F type ribosomal protection protein [Paenibacillus ehimensis]MDO3679671.1 ABC-F type ribosomal protection protein [Paenibacillus ehimensis]